MKVFKKYKKLILVLIVVLNIGLSFLFWRPGDLDCFLSSGAAVMRGDNPYSARAAHYSTDQAPSYNLNAPLSLLFFAPFAQLDLYAFHPYWIFGSVLSFIISLILLSRQYQPKQPLFLLVFAFSSFGDTLAVGNLYLFLLLIITLAWISFEKKHFGRAGLMIGLLVAIKPNFILWPILLLINRDFRVAIYSFLATLLFLSLPAIILGPSIYVDWIKLISTNPYFLDPLNVSILGIAMRLNLNWLRLPLMVMIIGSVIIWTIFMRPKTNALNGIALIYSFLASPLIWPTYSILLAPIFLSNPLSRKLQLAALILMVPTGPISYLRLFNPVAAGWISPIFTIGLIIIVLNFVFDKQFLTGSLLVNVKEISPVNK